MNLLSQIVGHGKNLTFLQMGVRGAIIFVITLILIRIAGRRSFGIRTPLDNIVYILLGSILSRAVAGASPFLPVILTSFVIVFAHRILGILTIRNKKLKGLIEGEKILLFENGQFINRNLTKALVCEDDVLQGVRKSALLDDLNLIDRVYMERNGEISAIKK